MPFLNLIIAVIASFITGMLWYSPMLFGTIWAKLKGFTKDSLKKAQQSMGPLYGVSLVATFVQAVVLFILLDNLELPAVQHEWGLAALLWLGFILPTQVTAMIFSNKKFNSKLLLIDTGYQLASVLVMTTVYVVLS